jgi:hypothetical protein
MAKSCSTSLTLAAVSIVIGMLVPTSAFAEAGSVGGTVGKHDKSLSGDLGEQTPPKSVEPIKSADPVARKPLPRTRTFVEPQDIAPHNRNDPCDGSGTLFAACH